MGEEMLGGVLYSTLYTVCQDMHGPCYYTGSECEASHILSSRQTVIHFCAAQNFVEFLHDLSELGATIDLADNKGGSCVVEGGM